MKLETLKQQIDEFFNSEAGDNAVMEIQNRLKREDEYIEIAHKKLTPKLIERILIWNKEHHNRTWNDTKVLSVCFNAARKYGKEIDLVEDFLAATYDYKGYRWQLICGQGCYYSVF